MNDDLEELEELSRRAESGFKAANKLTGGSKFGKLILDLRDGYDLLRRELKQRIINGPAALARCSAELEVFERQFNEFNMVYRSRNLSALEEAQRGLNELITTLASYGAHEDLQKRLAELKSKASALEGSLQLKIRSERGRS